MPWTPLPARRCGWSRNASSEATLWSATSHTSPPSAAVAAVGPAEGDGTLPPERHAARATVAAAHVELALVDELGHRVHATGRLEGAGGRFVRRPDTPSVSSRHERDRRLDAGAGRPLGVDDGRRADAATCASPTPIRTPRRRLRSAGPLARTSSTRLLCDGATRAVGAGNRARPEEPDEWRTCFERDRDRILHAPAFRRLAGKTQVFVFPDDHQRTRLTHALEVAQVATSVARTLGLNVALTEAIALGHDCGHGPGGHASEDALSPYVAGRLRPRRVGRRRHAGPAEPVRRDARRHPQPLVEPAGARRRRRARSSRGPIASPTCATTSRTPWRRASSAPTCCRPIVAERCGTVTVTAARHVHPGDGRCHGADRADRDDRAGRRGAGRVPPLQLRGGVPPPGQPGPGRRGDRPAPCARRALRAIARTCCPIPPRAAGGSDAAVAAAVSYVAGMTDRFACRQAVSLLGWDPAKLPAGVT